MSDRLNKNTNWKVNCEKITTNKRDESTDGDSPIIFNVDTQQYEGWDGLSWVSLGSINNQRLDELIKQTKSYGHIGVTSTNPFITTSDQLQLVDTWVFNLETSGYYELSIAIEWRLNQTNQDAIFEFTFNGVPGTEINQEPKDGTNRIFLTSFVLADLDEGPNTLEFYARKEISNTSELRVFSSRFTARRISNIS